jgi:hypothetical protein
VDFFFPPDECRVSIVPGINWPGNGPMRIRTEWTVDGEIFVPPALGLSPQASTNYLTAELLIRQQILAQPNFNLVYYAPVGSIAGQIVWNATYDGIHIEVAAGISPVDGEWANSLKYRITARAEVYQVNPPGGLVMYTESWSLGGGGPIVEFSEPITDIPKPIQLRAFTPYTATQSIQAIGRGAYPYNFVFPRATSFPPLTTPPEYDPGFPYAIGGNYVNFPLSMKASYKSAVPLNYSPRLVF